jgi:hypothetical protein
MGWTFFWLMVVLKIPIAALLYIVWWAIHSTDETEAGDGSDGGIRPPHRPRVPPHPRTRGPHGDPAAAPPQPRTRPVVTALGRDRVE